MTEYAFPRPAAAAHHSPQTGITTRDYFAAKAMQGIVADANQHYLGVTKIADWAYAQADAMMEARK
jgi:hypothetical protein